MPDMQNRSSKKVSRDVNQMAQAIVLAATTGDAGAIPTTDDGKNAAAVALGRLGGKKGGPARAAKLSKKKRSAIAKKAAEARWNRREASPADMAPSNGT
jgi:hypothetical protein